MKEYRIGEYYDFQVKGLNSQRLFLEDENGDKFSVNAYDFQTEWDWSSAQVPEQKIRCYVKQIHADGTIHLEQSKDILLITLYPEAYRKEKKVSTFTIHGVKTIKDTLYFEVLDAFGIRHLYKPVNNTYLQPGDEVLLNVIGLLHKENNRSRLEFEEVELAIFNAPQTTSPVESNDETTSLNVSIDTTNNIVETSVQPGEFGEETNEKEFKSTIVYPAGATGADIDKQIRIIIQTIAGFMNAKGGELYIGVNNNGEPIGIEQDFPLLDSSSIDKNSYMPNTDGYENKIRNAIRYLLNPEAIDYVDITFSQHNGHTICLVKVEESRTVIWLDQFKAYKRTGNSTTRLRSTAIEKLVLDKMDLKRPEAYRIKPTEVTNEDEVISSEDSEDFEVTDTSEVKKVNQPETIKYIGETIDGRRGSFYMNLFSNGDWSWSKEIPSDTDLEFCIPINNPVPENFLIMVYDDGCVNKVNAYEQKKQQRTHQNVRFSNGRRSNGANLVKVFSAKKNDLLACFCKQKGHEFVKVHKVSHVGERPTIDNNGNILINAAYFEGVTDPEISFVAAEHTHRISDLIKTENQKSNSLGVQMDLPRNAKYSSVRDTLKALLDVPAHK